MAGLLFLTIATGDYLARAAVLNASLRAAYGDEVKLAVLWVADPDAPVPDGLEFDLVRLDDLGAPTLWDMAFRYEKGAFANALKPFFIQQMFRDRRPGSIVFLDADTLIYSRFDEVHALLDSGGASIVVTPHFDRPQARTREPYEIDLLRQGVTNGGFVALAANPDSEAFLSWWATHLLTECRYEIDQGLYGDQHWLDLAPALFNGVHVLRHRGYNAAYWNFPDRSPRSEEGRWLIGPDPLRFYHFSQWRTERGETVEASMERLFCGGNGDLAELLSDYLERWTKEGATLPPEVKGLPYPFEAFKDGTRIPKIVRDSYAGSNSPRSATLDQLFGQGLAPFLEASSKVPAFEGIEMPQLYVHIWNSRSDLRHLDLFTYEGQLNFMRWAVRHAGVDYSLPEELMEPAQQALAMKAEQDRLIDVARSDAIEAYSRVRKGGAALDDLMKPARVLIAMFEDRTGINNVVPIDVPSLFEAISVVKTETQKMPDQNDFAHFFKELSGHRDYYNDKVKAFPTNIIDLAHLIDKVALESDTVLNSCNMLIEILRRWPPRRRG